jgi:hypothetical protein
MVIPVAPMLAEDRAVPRAEEAQRAPASEGWTLGAAGPVGQAAARVAPEVWTLDVRVRAVSVEMRELLARPGKAEQAARTARTGAPPAEQVAALDPSERGARA